MLKFAERLAVTQPGQKVIGGAEFPGDELRPHPLEVYGIAGVRGLNAVEFCSQLSGDLRRGRVELSDDLVDLVQSCSYVEPVGVACFVDACIRSVGEFGGQLPSAAVSGEHSFGNRTPFVEDFP